MPLKPTCECGVCRVCKRRVQKRKERALNKRAFDARKERGDILRENISSSVNLFKLMDFYLGQPPPKNGRVAPKPAS